MKLRKLVSPCYLVEGNDHYVYSRHAFLRTYSTITVTYDDKKHVHSKSLFSKPNRKYAKIQQVSCIAAADIKEH